MTTPQKVTKSITAENTFSDAVQLDRGDKCAVNASGTFSATLTPQRSFDGGTTWYDVTEADGTAIAWTGVVGCTYEAEIGCQFRVGCKSGDFTSGTANIELRAGT